MGSSASGLSHVILVHDGDQWAEQLVSLDSAQLTSIRLISAADGWAVGTDIESGAGLDEVSGVMLRWDGSEWHQAAPPPLAAEAVDMPAPTMAGPWATATRSCAGTATPGTQPIRRRYEGWLHDVALVGPGDGWIVGDRVYGGGFWLRYAAIADPVTTYLPALLRAAWPDW